MAQEHFQQAVYRIKKTKTDDSLIRARNYILETYSAFFTKHFGDAYFYISIRLHIFCLSAVSFRERRGF